MNKLYITHSPHCWIYTPVGNETFVNRWKNLVYNFMKDKSFGSTAAIPYPHFLIRKDKFWKILKLSLKTEIRVKYKHLTKEERREKLDKIHDFYLKRVIKNTCEADAEQAINQSEQWQS